MSPKITPIKRPRTPELEPMSADDFEANAVADHLDGLVGTDEWEKAQHAAADSQWGLS